MPARMPDDSMGTMTAASPGTLAPHSVAEVAEAVRVAHRDGTPLRIVGRGGWLRAGDPVQASRVLDVSGLRGIVEYVPGDLTLTALAGTPLTDIAAATADHGQWLPLDPFGDPRGTLGATLATASAGPLGGSIGLPRDTTVGLSYVTGSGEVVHGGGRVVKNVAGFDLVRLTIGAWGTLGVITEATVRLRARPEADETIAMTLPDGRDALAALVASVRIAAVEPLAAELLSPACAARIGLRQHAVMLVRLAGNATSVHHQRATLGKLAASEPLPPEVWSFLQQSDPEDGAVLRVSRRPSELARLWMTAMALPEVDAHATLARGVVRIRLTSPRTVDGFEAADHVVVETCPAAFRDRIAPTQAPAGALSRRLRDAFDPDRILNRGILGEDDT